MNLRKSDKIIDGAPGIDTAINVLIVRNEVSSSCIHISWIAYPIKMFIYNDSVKVILPSLNSYPIEFKLLDVSYSGMSLYAWAPKGSSNNV